LEIIRKIVAIVGKIVGLIVKNVVNVENYWKNWDTV